MEEAEFLRLFVEEVGVGLGLVVFAEGLGELVFVLLEKVAHLKDLLLLYEWIYII